MSRRIDRVFGLIVLCVGALWLFLGATGSLPAALLLTAVWGVLVCSAWRAFHNRYGTRRNEKAGRLRAGKALVAHWAALPDVESAHAHLLSRYPECAPYALELLARHPSSPPLDASELLAIWRAHDGSDRLVLATTGLVAPVTRAISGSLKAPCVQLLDGAALAHAVALSDLPIAQAPKLPLRPRFVLNRKRAPLMLMYALFMLLLYYLTGQTIYLLLGIGLIAVAAFALKRENPPDRLFS